MTLHGGYWRLWHSMQLRAVAAVLIMCAVLYGGFVPNRPKACVRESDGSSFGESVISTQRLQQLKLAPALEPGRDRMVHAGMILQAHCPAGSVGNMFYPRFVGRWRMEMLRGLWGRAVPYTMLFLGILLAVGAPFSGESTESFALTFSLPWSRERWLIAKCALSVLVLGVLLFIAWATTVLSLHFKYMNDLTPYSTLYPFVYDRSLGDWVIGASSNDLLRATLSGLVGICLGAWASMLWRNALAGVMAAGAVAYALIGVDLGDITANMLYRGTVLLSLENTGSMIAAVVVICGTSALAFVRLRHTDF